MRFLLCFQNTLNQIDSCYLWKFCYLIDNRFLCWRAVHVQVTVVDDGWKTGHNSLVAVRPAAPIVPCHRFFKPEVPRVKT